MTVFKSNCNYLRPIDQSVIFLRWSCASLFKLTCLILLISGFNLSIVSCHNHEGSISIAKVVPIEKTNPTNQYRNSYTNGQLYSPELTQRANGCIEIDGICLSPTDVASYEAIKSLHAHLDDDHSGDIDLSESVDFLREELNYTKGFEKRQRAFHHNDDQHISVQELWRNWLSNEVHNWTVEQAVAWLSSSVELGQYADIFYENAINGSMLPRLATNNDQYLTRILGIKNPTHRSKIGIKAMDIVLFGPPKDTGSIVKDMFILSLLAFITVLLYKFMTMRKRNEVLFKKMDQDMEALQGELMKFHEEKKDLDVRSKQNKSIIADDQNIDEDIRLHEMERLEEVDMSPHNENSSWDDKCISGMNWSTTDLDMLSKNKLELWLQLTYEREKIAFSNKVEDTKRQLTEARERYDKLKPNKKNFFGALSFIHGNIESKGQPITEAQSAIEEIKKMSEEMKFRWLAIEDLLGIEIMRNHGLAKLELILEPNLQRFTRAPSAAVGMNGSSDLVRGTAVSTRSLATESLKGSSSSSRSAASESLRGTSLSSRSIRSTASEEGTVLKGHPLNRSNTHSSMMSETESVFGSVTNIPQNHLGGSVRVPALPRTYPTNSLQQSHTVGSDLNHYKSGCEIIRSSSFNNESKGSKIFVTSAPDVQSNNCQDFSAGDSEKLKRNEKSALKPKVSSSSTLRGSQTTLTGSREDILESSPHLRISPSKVRPRANTDSGTRSDSQIGRATFPLEKPSSYDENEAIERVEEKTKNSIRFDDQATAQRKAGESDVSLGNGNAIHTSTKKSGSSKFFVKFGLGRKSEKSKKTGNL